MPREKQPLGVNTDGDLVVVAAAAGAALETRETATGRLVSRFDLPADAGVLVDFAVGSGYVAVLSEKQVAVVDLRNATHRWSIPRAQDSAAADDSSPAHRNDDVLCFGSADTNLGVARSGGGGTTVDFLLQVNLEPLQYMGWGSKTFGGAGGSFAANLCSFFDGSVAVAWSSSSAVAISLMDLNQDPMYDAVLANNTSPGDIVTSIAWSSDQSGFVVGTLGAHGGAAGAEQVPTAYLLFNGKVPHGESPVLAADAAPGAVFGTAIRPINSTTPGYIIATTGNSTTGGGMGPVARVYKVV
jgi:hypothetical protein